MEEFLSKYIHVLLTQVNIFFWNIGKVSYRNIIYNINIYATDSYHKGDYAVCLGRGIIENANTYRFLISNDHHVGESQDLSRFLKHIVEYMLLTKMISKPEL